MHNSDSFQEDPFSLDNATDLSSILQKVAEQSLRTLTERNEEQYCVSHVALVDGQNIRFAAATADQFLHMLHLRVGTVSINDPKAGIAGLVARTGQKCVVPNTLSVSLYKLTDHRIESQIAVPLIHQDKCIGVITLESIKSDLFTPEDIRHVELVAKTATVAIAYHPEWIARQRRITQELDQIFPEDPYSQKSYVRKLIIDLKLKGVFASINRIFSEFAVIPESKSPLLAFDNIFAAVLPRICKDLGAHYGAILKDSISDSQLKLLQVYSEIQHPTKPQPRYRFNDKEWQTLAQGKGVYVGRASMFSGRKHFHLPFNEWGLSSERQEQMEVGIIRIGGRMNDGRYILILVKDKADKDDPGRNPLTFQMQADTFDLIALRLHETYNTALHMQAQLQYDQDRQQFIQDVMHQLNSSLGAIKADVENLVDGIIPAVEYPQAFDRLYSLASMFQGYTKTFVLAADNRSVLEVYRTPFSIFTSEDLVKLLKEHSHYFEGKARNAGLVGPTVDEASFTNFPPLRIHKELFELVMFNLYDNAVKYSFEHVDAPITVTGHVLEDTVEIHMINHGIQLTAKESESIFNRFERTHTAINYVGVGTGIGLYLCKEILRHHDGSIRAVPSKPSPLIEDAHEVTFVITLPKHKEEPS